MTDEERIRDFQRKIYLKAKQEKEYKFYILYDKVCSIRFIREAYRRVRKNKGSAGADGLTFEKIEENGIEDFLNKIQKELKEKTYKPQAVKRVYIPKANGKKRPLGIPVIRDRVVQMACKMVIEPIFEADFEKSSYGFRPKRSAQDAVKEIKKNLKNGKIEIFDADLSSYFDTIPHDKLMILLSKRISDNDVLHLIKMWLKSPIIENGKISGGKKNKFGTPQGGVISPLLSNIYLNLLDKIVNKTGGEFFHAGVKIIRYADDFVLMGNKIIKQVTDKLRNILTRMELKINEEKSRLINAEKTSFDFLGFTFRYIKAKYDRNRKFWDTIPSKKSCKKIRENIKTFLKRNNHWSANVVVDELNPKIRGWINYFTIPHVSYVKKAKHDLQWYLCVKLYRYYKGKSQKKCKIYKRAFEYLVKRYRLINPVKYETALCESC